MSTGAADVPGHRVAAGLYPTLKRAMLRRVDAKAAGRAAADPLLDANHCPPPSIYAEHFAPSHHDRSSNCSV
jgi:hypothetical protein